MPAAKNRCMASGFVNNMGRQKKTYASVLLL